MYTRIMLQEISRGLSVYGGYMILSLILYRLVLLLSVSFPLCGFLSLWLIVRSFLAGILVNGVLV